MTYKEQVECEEKHYTNSHYSVHVYFFPPSLSPLSRALLESQLEDNYSMGLHEVVGLAKWESLSQYVTSLKQGGEETQEQVAGAPRKRGRPPKRKLLDDGPLHSPSLIFIYRISSLSLSPSPPAYLNEKGGTSLKSSKPNED